MSEIKRAAAVLVGALLFCASASAATFRVSNKLESAGYAVMRASADVLGEINIATTPDSGYALRLSSGDGAAGQELIWLSTSGRLAIGQLPPEDALHLTGRFRIDNNADDVNKGCIRYNGGTNLLEYSNDCSSYQAFSQTGGNGWTDGGIAVYPTTLADYVSVGVSSSAGRLYVGGSALVVSSMAVLGTGMIGVAPVFQVIGGTLTVQPTGRVGVGTQWPLSKLTVYDNPSENLTGLTQVLGNNGLVMQTQHIPLTYTPGFFWATSNNSPTRPKGGIWLYETPGGTDMYFGVSNAFATGITNAGSVLLSRNGYMGIRHPSPSERVDVRGEIQASGMIFASAGAETTPSISFFADRDTGLFHPAGDQVAFSVGGIQAMAVTDSDIATTVPWRGQNGAVGTPNLSFTGDTDTGLWRTAEQLNFTVGATNRMAIVGGTEIQATLPLRVPAGVVAEPAYSFSGDPDTGMYALPSDVLAFTTGGTERMRINGAGYIGIDNSSPEQTLDLVSTFTVRHLADATSGAPLQNSNLLVLQGAYYSGGNIAWPWRLQNIVSSVAPQYRLSIQPYDGATEAMIIRNDGYVGIGTVNPAQRLDVQGGNIQTQGAFLTSAASAAAPAYTFTARNNDGMFSNADNELNFSVSGVSPFKMDTIAVSGTVPLRGVDGTQAVPALSFSGDPDTGLYRCSTTEYCLAYTSVGTARMWYYQNYVASTLPWRGIDGGVTAPSYSFIGETDTGFYRSGENTLDFTLGGSSRLTISAAEISTPLIWRGQIGSPLFPALSFYNDSNTGMYRAWPDLLAFASGDVKRLEIGVSSITATLPLRGTGGSAAEPAFSFIDQTDTGVYLVGVGTMSFSLGGASRLDIGLFGIMTPLLWHGVDGTAVAPAFSYATDNNTGLYRPGEDQLGFATFGVNRMTINGSTDIQTTLPLRAASGSAAAPSYTFSGNEAAGIYLAAAEQLGFATGGVRALLVNNAVTVRSDLPIYGVAGTLSVLALSFAGDLDTGFYRPGADQLAFATNGINRLLINGDTDIQSTLPVRIPNGDQPSPAFSFSGDPDTGMYWGTTNQVVFTTAGTYKLYLDTAQIGATLPLRSHDGTAGSPAYSFSGDNDTGIYRSADDTLNIATDGADRLIIGPSDIVNTQIWRGQNGTAGAPAFSFTGDNNNGIYRVGADVISFSANSANRMELAVSSVAVYLALRGADGSAAAPAFSFTGDDDTGVYLPAPNTLGLALGGAGALTVGVSDIVTPLLWRGANGTEAAPAFSFSPDTNNGVYHPGEDLLAFSAGSTKRLEIGTSSVTFTLSFLGQTGTAGAPAFSFYGDQDTGFYRSSADTLSFSVGGYLPMEIAAAVVRAYAPVRGIDGTAVSPAFSFYNDSDTGMYRPGGDQLGFATLGLNRMTINGATDIQTALPWRLPAAMGYALGFAGDLDTGIYQSGGDQLVFGAGSAARMVFNGTTDILAYLPWRAPDGTALVPSYSFRDDEDTGIYLAAADQVGFAAQGVNRMTITAADTQSTLPLRAPSASAGTPSYSFSSDPDTGIYWTSADRMDFSAGNGSRMAITGSEVMPLVQFKVQNGTAEEPALSFLGDEDTGIYRSSPDTLEFTVGGSSQITVGASDITIALPWRGANGTAVAPAFSFYGDNNNGLYRLGPDLLAFSANSANRMDIGTSSVTLSLALRGPDGTAAAPGFSFAGDPDTGFYRLGIDTISFTVGGVGKLAVGAYAVVSPVPWRGTDGTAGSPAYSFTADPGTDTGIYRAGAGQLGFATQSLNRMTINRDVDIQSSLRMRGSAGVAVAPSFSFTGDTDTGMYDPAGDQLAFSVGGANRLVVTGATDIVSYPYLRGTAGTASAPAFSFYNDEDTGIYMPAPDQLGFAAGGAAQILISGTEVQAAVPWRGQNGTAGAPAFSFSGDTDTGIYRVGADQMGFVTAGTFRMGIGANIQASLPWRGTDGSAAEPSLSFTGDEDTGIYRPASDTIGFTVEGSDRLTLGASAMAATLPWRGANGALAAPSLSFSGDINTGMYRSGVSDQFGLAVNGVNKLDVGLSSVAFSQALRGADGSAAAPEFSFIVDDNTGLYRSGANTVDLSVGGSGRMSVSASEVKATLPWRGGDGTAAAPAFSFSDPDNGFYLAGADQLGFATLAANRMTLSGAEIQASLPLRGQLDAVAAAPSLSFLSDPDTGLFRSAENTLSFSVGGASVLDITAAAVNHAVPWYGPDGSAAAPSLSFYGDDNTGLYRASADQLGFAAGGISRMTINGSASIQASLPWRGANGAIAAPAYSFANDPNTGIYRNAVDGHIAFSAGGNGAISINAASDIYTGLSLHGPDGTYDAPALSFADDHDSGVYRPAEDQLGFSVGGAGAMAVNSDVDLQGALPWRGANGTMSAPSISFTGDNNTGVYHTVVADQFAFVAGGVTRLNIGLSSVSFSIPWRGPAGAVSAPAFAFTGETGTGIYRPASNTLDLAIGGVSKLTIGVTEITTPLIWRAQSGSVSEPAYSFTGDPNTGIFRAGTNLLNFAAGGVERMFVNGETDIQAAKPLRGVDGVVLTPAFSFQSDTNTGIYSLGAGTVSFTVGGVSGLDIGYFAVITPLPWYVPAGEAAAPSLSFYGDDNTGIYSAGPDQLGFATMGANVLTINSDVDIQSALAFRGQAAVPATPAFSFTGDNNTGMFRIVDGQFGFMTGGVDRMDIGTSSISITMPLRGPAGTAAAPAFSFTSDPDVGLYAAGANQLGFATIGQNRMTINGSTDIQATLPLRVPVTVNAGAPYFSFTGDTNTGIYWVAAKQLGLSVGGTLRMGIYADTYIGTAVPWYGVDGAVSAPALSFAGAPDTGIYWYGVDQIGLALGGADALVINFNVEMQTALPWRGQNGIVGAPAFSFTGDSNTGAFYSGPDQVSFVTNGISRMDVGPSGIALTLPLRAPDGSVSAPQFSFSGDTDTGLFRPAADSLSFVAGGVSRLDLAATAVTALPLYGPGGTAAAPAFAFTGSPAAGVYRAGENQLGLSAVGANVMTIDSDTDIQAALPLRGADGAALSPSLSFLGDPDTGIFRVAVDTMGFTAGGVNQLYIGNGGIGLNLLLRGAAGDESAPAISFSGDPDNGIYSSGPDLLGFASFGAKRMEIGTSSTVLTVPWAGAAGTAPLPAFSFTGDPNTGMYRLTTDQFGFATNGVLRMDVSNSAVTGVLPLHGVDGTAGAPAFSFAGDTDTGVYRYGLNQLGFATEGVNRMLINAAADVQPSLPWRGANGALATPAFSFFSDVNSGIYRSGAADQFAFVTTALNRLDIGAISVTSSLPLRGNNGSAAAPAITFADDTDTGVYYTADNQLGFATNGVNRMNINAAVDIQTTLPLLLPNGSFTVPALSFYADTNTGMYDIGADTICFVTNASTRVCINGDGYVGIGITSPTYSLQLASDSAAKPVSNTWTVDSDLRLKKNVETMDNALNKMLALHGVTYEWKDPAAQGGMKGRYMGLIAQEVEKVFPQWVGTNVSGYKDLTVSGFQGLTAEAMRELNAKKDALKLRLEEQRRRIEELKRKLGGDGR